MKRRLDLDLKYIRSWLPWLDFRIMAKTVPVVFGEVLRVRREPRGSQAPCDPLGQQQDAEPGIGGQVSGAKSQRLLAHAE